MALAARLVGMNKTVKNALIAAGRLFEIMDLERESEENKMELRKGLVGNIIFKDISFTYGTRAEVFKNFSLDIEKGKITDVIGESGSGKTTLIALLQKLYTINSGSITIGDYNINMLTNHSLRHIVSVVPQQLDLFSGNVLENIALGDFEPDMERVVDICKDLGILSFIKSLPANFGIYIGENGATPSGGQKQRLAIARALYRQPEILLLDEATSALDTESEKYVKSTISKLREQGKTIITDVSHHDKDIINERKSE